MIHISRYNTIDLEGFHTQGKGRVNAAQHVFQACKRESGNNQNEIGEGEGEEMTKS